MVVTTRGTGPSRYALVANIHEDEVRPGKRTALTSTLTGVDHVLLLPRCAPHALEELRRYLKTLCGREIIG